MKVIKFGEKVKLDGLNRPAFAGWTTTCNHCGTEYSFDLSDSTPVLDKEDKIKNLVQCPGCGHWRKLQMQ